VAILQHAIISMLRLSWRRPFVAVLCYCSLSSPSINAFAQNLLPNGSFENGAIAPIGWKSSGGGTIATNIARSGDRSLRGTSQRGAVVWTSDKINLGRKTDYRLDGWVRCYSGEAKLRVDLFNDQDQPVGHTETPQARQSLTWQYIASEWNSLRATSARISFWVKGQADLDDVSLTPVATRFMGNKGVEGDERGRIPFWGEEKKDTLLPGPRAGQFRLDSEVKREGKTSVQLVSTGEWFAVSSVNYPLPAWTDAFEFSGWARCDQSASAQLLACWADGRQTVLRIDRSDALRGGEWHVISLIPPAPPSNTAAVRLVAAARGGKVWFDDFDLLRLRPRQKSMRLFVNQVGYGLEGPKSAVVAANFFPLSGKPLTFQLLNPKGKVVWKQEVSCAGRN